ncbi:MAG: hypothetical protein VX899_19585 [Myxococcota bacterium]|nr:hypothetical protein [Myxococcota bacterium]
MTPTVRCPAPRTHVLDLAAAPALEHPAAAVPVAFTLRLSAQGWSAESSDPGLEGRSVSFMLGSKAAPPPELQIPTLWESLVETLSAERKRQSGDMPARLKVNLVVESDVPVQRVHEAMRVLAAQSFPTVQLVVRSSEGGPPDWTDRAYGQGLSEGEAMKWPVQCPLAADLRSVIDGAQASGVPVPSPSAMGLAALLECTDQDRATVLTNLEFLFCEEQPAAVIELRVEPGGAALPGEAEQLWADVAAEWMALSGGTVDPGLGAWQ